MPFFKDLRRRSRANFKDESVHDPPDPSDAAAAASEESSQSTNAAQDSKSTSTLNSTNGGPVTAVTSAASASAPGKRTVLQRAPSNALQRTKSGPIQRSTSFLSRSTSTHGQKVLGPVDEAPPVPPRPPNKRLSTASNYSESMANAPRVPASFYAPRVTSIQENGWVNQKVLLINGQAGPVDRPLDGTITVTHLQDSFPPTSWSVTETYFKALVYLTPGHNDLRIDFSSPKLMGTDSPNALHSTRFRINYLPLNSTPPLQLAILVAKDSPGTFDAPPEKIQKEGNDLELAIRKFRMTGHLWAAFTAEQMYRHGFGRRTFRFDEEYQPATLSSRDAEAKTMRNETKVHVIRSSRTMAEIRDFQVAQQNKNATRKGDLFGWAMEDVQGYFKSGDKQKQYVACLILDSHWNVQHQLITGHAALGGGTHELGLGIFGSHALHTYPSTIEEVVPALTDCTKTNTDYVAADGGQDSGAWWQAACIGIGAHLHEVGHLLGCPHQVSGIMEHAYWYFNRTFVTAEPYSTRTQQPGLRPCLPNSECGWHRLDALRFRCHPCFRTPFDSQMHPERGIQVWAVDGGRFIITARTGLNLIEMFADDDEFCAGWIEYTDREGAGESLARHIELTESEIRARLPPEKQKARTIKIVVHSLGGECHELPDIRNALRKVKMPKGLTGFLGPKYGASAMDGSMRVQQLITSLMEPKKLLIVVRIFHDFSVHGVELIYEDGTVDLFGKRSGKSRDVILDIRRGETLAGFYLRAGFWVDALAVITSSGRRSEVFGNARGGEEYTLLPPRGYRIAGLHGTCAQWLDGFGIIITR